MCGGVYQPSRVCNFSNSIFSETQFHILFNIATMEYTRRTEDSDS